MADLLDIAPSTAVAVVTIDGLRVKVRAVSFDAMASIVARFPALKSLANGDGDIVSRLIAGCGAAVGPIIAAGCGHLGEEEYEQRAATLLPDQQIKFIQAILELTFPNGIGSFVEALTGLVGAATASGGAKKIKVRLKNSHSPLPSSADASASHPTMQ